MDDLICVFLCVFTGCYVEEWCHIFFRLHMTTKEVLKTHKHAQLNLCKPIKTSTKSRVPFPTFSAIVPHRSQCFHAILELCNFPSPLRGGVFVHVWVCASVCRVIAAHWKPQRGQPQESLTVVSGSPLFCPPSFTSTTFP